MNINPFINLIAAAISFYSWILIAWIILTWLIHFKIVNQYQPFIAKLSEILYKLTEPVLRPLRKLQFKLFGNLGGIDLSPVFLVFILFFIRDSLYTYFYQR